jgi:hypothetical protein
MQYFTDNWHDTFTVHFPNSINAQLLLFSKAQFTAYPRKSCTLINARTDMSDHGLPQTCNGPGAASSISTGIIKRDGEVCLRFKLELNAVGFLVVPTNKNLMCWIQHVIGLYLENWVFVALYCCECLWPSIVVIVCGPLLLWVFVDLYCCECLWPLLLWVFVALYCCECLWPSIVVSVYGPLLLWRFHCSDVGKSLLKFVKSILMHLV